MSATIGQAQQLLPCIGTSSNTTALRSISKGSLLQYKRAGSSRYGVVKAFRYTGNVLYYTLCKAEQFNEFVTGYETEQGTEGIFQVKRKSSAKVVAELDTARCIVISVEEVDVRSTMVQAVGVLFDAGQYRKMSRSVQPSPWVFWTLFEIDEDNDLCCKNDTAIYSYSGLRSDIHQAATLEVRAAATRVC
jgi:hypothetical protein